MSSTTKSVLTQHNIRWFTGNAAYSIAAYWQQLGELTPTSPWPVGGGKISISLRCLTGDTLVDVNTVTVRDLRNNGGEVLRRVEHGERIVVTRDGAPVAELRPLPRSSASPTELIRRRKNLPRVNPDALRRDIDNLIDPTL